MDTACKHPKVRVVAREEDVEYVECLDCGQVFDSNEFRDMEIEEEVFGEAEEEDIR
jgi:Zn ribbon nucleic-acid-binding protein